MQPPTNSPPWLVAVCDASPLIALEAIGCLELLPDMFTTLVAPPAVLRELRSIVKLPGWLEERALSEPIPSDVCVPTLGPGEQEALALTVEIGAAWLIADERPARQLARSLGLQVIGTLGILVAARKQGQIDSLGDRLSELQATGFFLTQDLYDWALTEVGEKS